MALLTFPAIAPNKLTSVTLPDFAMLVKDFSDGGEIRRTAQHIGAGTMLSLSYQLISHVDAATIVSFWATTKGTWLSFYLPTVIINHPDNIRIGLARFDSTNLWRFSQGLQLKTDYATLQRGLYSFNVEIQSVVS